MNEGGQKTRTCGSQGMAQGNGASVNVNLVPIPSDVGQLLAVGQDLGGESLVQLDKVDVGQGPARFLEQQGNGFGWGGGTTIFGMMRPSRRCTVETL